MQTQPAFTLLLAIHGEVSAGSIKGGMWLRTGQDLVSTTMVQEPPTLSAQLDVIGR